MLILLSNVDVVLGALNNIIMKECIYVLPVTGINVEYVILKPSFVTELSVTNNTNMVFPLLKTSGGRGEPQSLPSSGALVSLPS